MPIIDVLDTFSSAQAVTASAISDVKDLGPFYTSTLQSNTTVNLGATGQEVYLVINVTEAATAAGAATVTFSLESDSTADLATSATVHWTSAAIPKATLVAGYNVIKLCLPYGAYERYLGVRYTVATGPLTAGKFDAFLTNAADYAAYYAAGSTIQ